MTIDWLAFVLVVAVSVIGASAVVTVFSLGLRLGDGEERWRRPASIGLFVLAGLIVLFGLWLVVPFFH